MGIQDTSQSTPTSQGSRILVLAGGGTGGHVVAGLSVAEVWQRSGGLVYFIGSYGGLEEKLVPPQRIPLFLLRMGALNRVSLVQKLKTFWQLPWAFWQSAFWLLRWKPTRVLGVGGFASGPVLLAAWVLRMMGLLPVEIAVLEQNSVLGLTNRLLIRIADFLFLAFPLSSPLSDQYRLKKIQVVGNPIRSSIQRLPASTHSPFTLFIFGGSRGAVGMNTLVLQALPELKTRALELKCELRIIHQTGVSDYERVRKAYDFNGLLEAEVLSFIDDMPAAYAKASLVICRSGSSTLAEVAAVGRAAIFVPLPTAADHHQFKNAQVFSAAGAARLVDQYQTSGSALARSILELIENPEQISDMEQKVTQFYRPHAAEDIVQGLEL